MISLSETKHINYILTFINILCVLDVIVSFQIILSRNTEINQEVNDEGRD